MARLFKSLHEIPQTLLPAELRSHGAAAPAPRKYGNVPIEVDGIKFASKKQARRWRELQILQRAGEINQLMPEVSFPIGGGHRMRVDALYRRASTGETVWEDTKGHVTPEWKLKRDIAEKLYGIKITTV